MSVTFWIFAQPSATGTTISEWGQVEFGQIECGQDEFGLVKWERMRKRRKCHLCHHFSLSILSIFSQIPVRYVTSDNEDNDTCHHQVDAFTNSPLAPLAPFPHLYEISLMVVTARKCWCINSPPRSAPKNKLVPWLIFSSGRRLWPKEAFRRAWLEGRCVQNLFPLRLKAKTFSKGLATISCSVGVAVEKICLSQTLDQSGSLGMACLS